MTLPSTVKHPVPDQHGVNLFHADPDLAALLRVYLPPDLFEHLLPHLQELGGLAGGLLDTLAQTADKNPPELVHRSRTGVDAQHIVKHPAYVELEKVAFSRFGLAAASHRAGVLGWPAPLPPIAKYAFTYLYVQAEFGVCCPLSMTDSLTRTLRKFAAPALVGHSFVLAGIRFEGSRLLAGVVGLGVTLLLHVILTRTAIGSRMLAVSEDATAAQLMGIRPQRMQALVGDLLVLAIQRGASRPTFDAALRTELPTRAQLLRHRSSPPGSFVCACGRGW